MQDSLRVYLQKIIPYRNTLRKYYLYVVKGTATINGRDLIEGDGLSYIEESTITITNKSNQRLFCLT
jgi:redox-sensitive bicupin YhaK (pirin superfamily)